MADLTSDQRALLDEKLFGIVATVDRSGKPYQVLVWYMLDGEEILVTTHKTTQKAKNIQSTGWMILTVSQGPRYITVRGHATVDDDPERTQTDYERIVNRYLPPEAAAKWIADSADSMNGRVILHMPIEHVGRQMRG
jgi:PPOX class probable F420-dependent enzyme